MKEINWKSMLPNQENMLAWTLCVSIVLHAILLAVEFKFPGTIRKVTNKALDVILVNAPPSERSPAKPQALAQHKADGGGDRDEDVRPESPLPLSYEQKEGSELERVKQVKQEEVKPQPKQNVLTQQTQSQIKSKPVEEVKPTVDDSPKPSGQDLVDDAMAKIQMQAEIGPNTLIHSQWPRKRFIGIKTDDYRLAQYVEDWRVKIEKFGTINYPEKARGKLYGSLLLTVGIRADGSVESIEIDRSSGHKVLDDAARRIVRLSEPFAEFPPGIRQDTDLIYITRTWNFTNKDELHTK